MAESVWEAEKTTSGTTSGELIQEFPIKDCGTSTLHGNLQPAFVLGYNL